MKHGRLLFCCLLFFLCMGCNDDFSADISSSERTNCQEETTIVSTTPMETSAKKTPKTTAHSRRNYTPDEFSQTELEYNIQMFSKVTAATLIVDGEAVPLETDDPRLIRMLNLLSYAVSIQDVGWTQGYVDASWVKSAEETENRLEIAFQNGRQPADTFELQEYDRMVVYAGYFLCINYVDEPTFGCYEDGKRAMLFVLNKEGFSWSAKESLSLLEYFKFI